MAKKPNFNQENQHGNNTMMLIADPELVKETLKETMMVLLEKNLPELLDSANEEMNKRIDEFQEKVTKAVVSKIKDEGLDINKMAEPNTQYVINESQINYIRYPGEDKLHVLSELLSEKICNNSDINYYDVYLDETINVISKLSQEEIDILTFIYSAERLYLTYSNYVPGSFIKLFELNRKIHNRIKNNYALINRLQHLGAVNRSIGSVDRGKAFIKNCSSILNQRKKEDLDDKYIGRIIKNDVLSDYFTLFGVHDEEYIKLAETKLAPNIEFVCNNLNPNYKKYEDFMKDIDLFKNFYLTYVGVIISIINMNNNFGTNLDLKETINAFSKVQ